MESSDQVTCGADEATCSTESAACSAPDPVACSLVAAMADEGGDKLREEL